MSGGLHLKSAAIWYFHSLIIVNASSLLRMFIHNSFCATKLSKCTALHLMYAQKEMK